MAVIKDFNGQDLKVGDTIFFTHASKKSVLGRISEFEGKKTIHVHKEDVIKAGPKLDMTEEWSGLMVNADDVIKIIDNLAK